MILNFKKMNIKAMNEDKPAYYSIMPANVRYDNRLRDKAKLLYSEITALANKDGYCFATNRYFAELYQVTETTISTLIAELDNYNYVRIFYNDGKRCITIDSNICNNIHISDKYDYATLANMVLESQTYIDKISMDYGYTRRQVEELLENFNSYQQAIDDRKTTIKDYKIHFLNWVRKNNLKSNNNNGNTNNGNTTIAGQQATHNNGYSELDKRAARNNLKDLCNRILQSDTSI